MFGKHSNHSSNNTNNTTLIGRGARLKGALELEGDIHIEGQCEGTIRAQNQLSIGSDGSVIGELSGDTVVIAGRVQGTAIAKETLHILNTGSLQGDAFYGQLQVDPGGVIDGRTHQGSPPGALTTSIASESGRDLEEDSHEDSVVINTRSKPSSVAPAVAEVARSNAPGRR